MADFKDLNDIGMLEVRCDTGFVKKHLNKVVTRSEMGEDAFDHNRLADPCKAPLFGEEQLSHAAGCKFGEYLVVAK